MRPFASETGIKTEDTKSLIIFESYILVFFTFKIIIYLIYTTKPTALLLSIDVLFQLLSIFTVITAAFDLYSLGMAAPGSTHYGFYFISYQFVYVGNRYGMHLVLILSLVQSTVDFHRSEMFRT